MIGVDISLRPWAWAVPLPDRWISGEIAHDRDPAVALRDAVDAAHVRDRTVALAVPTRSVIWDTIPGLRLRAALSRKAAVLAAVERLKSEPREAVVSLAETPDGVMYAAAQRAAIEPVMAPWLSQGFAVPVVEPAAVSLLRGVGSDTPVVIVRTGEDEVEIVAGSRDRLLFARHVPGVWTGSQANTIKLEVDATIDSARRDGHTIERVLIGGHGELTALLAAFQGGASLVQLSAEYGAPEVPPWAVTAASAALWKIAATLKKPRHGHGGPKLSIKTLLRGIGRQPRTRVEERT